VTLPQIPGNITIVFVRSSVVICAFLCFVLQKFREAKADPSKVCTDCKTLIKDLRDTLTSKTTEVSRLTLSMCLSTCHPSIGREQAGIPKTHNFVLF